MNDVTTCLIIARQAIPRGLTARIAGFHPAGPGSTPGVGRLFLSNIKSKLLKFLHFAYIEILQHQYISYMQIFCSTIDFCSFKERFTAEQK